MLVCYHEKNEQVFDRVQREHSSWGQDRRHCCELLEEKD